MTQELKNKVKSLFKKKGIFFKLHKKFIRLINNNIFLILWIV